MPAAVDENSQPASEPWPVDAALAYGTNTDSQPTTSPFGTQSARYRGRVTGEQSSRRFTAIVRRTKPPLPFASAVLAARAGRSRRPNPTLAALTRSATAATANSPRGDSHSKARPPTPY